MKNRFPFENRFFYKIFFMFYFPVKKNQKPRRFGCLR